MRSYFIRKLKDCIEDVYVFFEIYGKKIPVFVPDHPFRFTFDIITLIYIVFLVANIILKFSFKLQENNYYPAIWILFQIMPGWIFLLEMLLNFNTSYYSKGVYISCRTQIIYHYFKYDFLLDLITIFPLFINQTEYGQYLQPMVAFRLVNVGNIVKRLEEYLQLKGKKEGVFQLIKLIINLIFFAHICACAWHYVGVLEIANGLNENWLIAKGIELDAWHIRYIYSFYFSIVTMMTVGYGDISPSNYIECSFVIFVVIYGCGFFAYSINNVGNIFKEMYQEDKEFKYYFFFCYFSYFYLI